jgi:hypothetical protein|tara:strand:+ start:2236 stop:2649 length:414 start_codon:yes stop_codon:yes gene_type:complete
MLEILSSCWSLLVGLGTSVIDVASLVCLWGWEVIYHLHMSAPRLEGLLVGIALAWIMLRRDKHPLLRVLSAPLKLTLDILDLAWDQVIEVTSDLIGTVRGWFKNSIGYVLGKVTASFSWVMGSLRSIKDRLLKKKED